MVKTPIYNDTDWTKLVNGVQYRIKNNVLYMSFLRPYITLDAVNKWKNIGKIPITLPFTFDFTIANNDYFGDVVDCRIHDNGEISVGSSKHTTIALTGTISLPL